MANNPIAAIWQILKEESSVYTLTNQNVYPNILPSHTGFPAIVYGQLSEDKIETKDALIPNGWRFQMEFYAENYADLQQLSEAVKAVLQYYDGTVPEIGAVKIRFSDQSDALWEDDKEVFKLIQDYRLK